MTVGLIVALVGLDGSGKTTVARRLAERELGAPVEYLYLGYNDDPTTWLLPTTRLIEGSRRRQRGTAGASARAGGDRRRDPSRPRRRGPLGAALRHVGAVSRLAEDAYRLQRAARGRRAGGIILLDRHPLVDLRAAALERERPSSAARLRAAIVTRFLGRPDLVLWLDAPADVLYARKGEQSIESLARRRELVGAAVGEQPGARTIDASRPLEAVVDEVAGLIVLEIASRATSVARPGDA